MEANTNFDNQQNVRTIPSKMNDMNEEDVPF